ncbi:uncharacterized protein LOC116940152 [Petromyzon marinus]|uniref:uncharacterized protein LOC116940152 n=1 Tax=Petromyzon marinus TaxID=7757 RepID=UPI003F72786D
MWLRLDTQLLSLCLLAAWQCGALHVVVDVSTVAGEATLSCKVTPSSEHIAVNWYSRSPGQSDQDKVLVCHPVVWWRSQYTRTCSNVHTYLADDNTFVLKVPKVTREWHGHYMCLVETWRWIILGPMWTFVENASAEVVLMSRGRNLQQPRNVTKNRNIQPSVETSTSIGQVNRTGNETQSLVPTVLLCGSLLLTVAALPCVCCCVMKKLLLQKDEESSVDQPEHLSDKEKEHPENVYDKPQGPKAPIPAVVAKKDRSEYVEMSSCSVHVDKNDYQVMGPHICKPSLSNYLNK